MATGITKLHSKGCPAKSGSRCRCGAGYEASVISRRDEEDPQALREGVESEVLAIGRVDLARAGVASHADPDDRQGRVGLLGEGREGRLGDQPFGRSV